MDKNSKSKMVKFIIFIVVLVLVVVVVGLISKPKQKIGQFDNLDAFAKCINNSGAKLYGAFWCSHCQNQRKMFGEAKDLLPYVECSSPDGQQQLEICKKEGIEGYPTWKFVDGSTLEGEQSLEKLSEKTACPLPQTTQ